MTDDFDEKPTPKPLGRAERQAFDAHYKSGAPSVNGDYDHEDTSPIDLFDRSPRDAEEAIIRHLRRDPKRLIEYVGKIAARAQQLSTEFRRRVAHESSENQRQLEELRELLNKPPNGALTRVKEQVDGLSEAVHELAERAEEIEKLVVRVESIESTIKGVRGFSKWAISGLITAVLGSAVGIIATLQARAKEEGAAAERSAQMRRDLDEIEERLNTQERRAPRRDYDYDIQPRHEPPKDKP